MLELYILEISKNLEKYDFNRLLDALTVEKQEKINRFHMFEDAQRSLIGDILARYAVCKRTGVKNKDIVIRANEYGKPILLEPNGIHFNISHSKKWVVCAIDNNPVGIDVETINQIDFDIAKRFFSKGEYNAILSQSEEMRLKYFYMIWTLKESYTKALGKGLSIPLNSFCINISDDNINLITSDQTAEFYFHQSFLDDSTVYALCSKNCYIKHSKILLSALLEDFLHND